MVKQGLLKIMREGMKEGAVLLMWHFYYDIWPIYTLEELKMIHYCNRDHYDGYDFLLY